MHWGRLFLLVFIFKLKALNPKICNQFSNICKSDPSCYNHSVFYRRCLYKKSAYTEFSYHIQSLKQNLRSLKSILTKVLRDEFLKKKLKPVLKDSEDSTSDVTVGHQNKSNSKADIHSNKIVSALNQLHPFSKEEKVQIVNDAVNVLNSYLSEASGKITQKNKRSKTGYLKSVVGIVHSYLTSKDLNGAISNPKDSQDIANEKELHRETGPLTSPENSSNTKQTKASKYIEKETTTNEKPGKSQWRISQLASSYNSNKRSYSLTKLALNSVGKGIREPALVEKKTVVGKNNKTNWGSPALETVFKAGIAQGVPKGTNYQHLFRSKYALHRKKWKQGKSNLLLAVGLLSCLCFGLFIASITLCYSRNRKEKSLFLIYKAEAAKDLQDLCRTRICFSELLAKSEEQETSMKLSWSTDAVPYNMDITTGHAVLSYMEDHIRNEDRLSKEWEALCSYKAEHADISIGADTKHITKNRFRDVLPYDRTRVKLREDSNECNSDYINANFIIDIDPRNPDYIVTQGPLDNTLSDFWQMVWEQGVVVIVNLTKLTDMGSQQCYRYWPEDGSSVYNIYEVHLISEHIWCDDYLVRSLYLKNLQTGETRTVTQFHYLTWSDVPMETKPLLEFRRKINKCYKGHSCPIVVHCNDGVGRTGTYVLMDMVLNKMMKGAREIDIAAALEHIRDQRADMVKTKEQFEFVLAAIAEEVTSILCSMPR